MTIVSHKIIKEIKKHLNVHYTPITTKEKSDLITLCNRLNDENTKLNLSPVQLMAIRDSFIYLLSKRVGSFVFKNGEDIMKMYKNHISILDIAGYYNVPPMSIVYQILVENKNESHKIQLIINKSSLLPKDIQSQMKSIVTHDPTHWYTYKIPNVFNKINKLKCPYCVKYDTKQLGKRPSVMFKYDCEYKKESFINWIEFKNYTLFDDDIFLHDIKKTLFNFSRFGTGLILFLDIICTKSFITKISVTIDTYDLFIKY
jgi:hypothetical protein